ncbi:MAG: NUDIX hydrolase [Micromonosporaceae bacterium]
MKRQGSVGSRLRGYGYQIFYRLPRGLRRRLVRLAVPTYTVGSVVLVRDPNNRMLFLRQPPGHGWSLPGGISDRGETPVVCAARELREESGLSVPAEGLSPAIPNAVAHPEGRWVDFVFEVTVDPDSHQITVDGGEVLEAQWHHLDALPPLTVPTARLLAEYGIGPYLGYR